MEQYIDIVIQKETENDRQYLLDRVRDPELGTGVSVVYIYTLVDEDLNYPDKPGHVIYIGEAGRPTEPTGKRFAQHISTREFKGGDSGTVYCLSRYYWKGKRIRLQVFIVASTEIRKEFERELLNAHVKEFGSLPICQGTTGSNYRTTTLSNFMVTQEVLVLFSPASNKSKQSGSTSAAAV